MVATEEKILVQVQLPKSLVKRLDHWRIEHDMTRPEAYTFMLAMAVAAAESRQAKGA